MTVKNFNGSASYTRILNMQEQRNWEKTVREFISVHQANGHFSEYRNFYVMNREQDTCETMMFCSFEEILPALSELCRQENAEVNFIADISPLHILMFGLTETEKYRNCICEYTGKRIIVRDKVTDGKEFMT